MKYMIEVLILVLSNLVALGLGWQLTKLYMLHKLNKDIDTNIELSKNGLSTAANDSVTDNKIYTFNWIIDNI